MCGEDVSEVLVLRRTKIPEVEKETFCADFDNKPFVIEGHAGIICTVHMFCLPILAFDDFPASLFFIAVVGS